MQPDYSADRGQAAKWGRLRPTAGKVFPPEAAQCTLHIKAGPAAVARAPSRELGVSADYLETGSDLDPPAAREPRLSDLELAIRLGKIDGAPAAPSKPRSAKRTAPAIVPRQSARGCLTRARGRRRRARRGTPSKKRSPMGCSRRSTASTSVQTSTRLLERPPAVPTHQPPNRSLGALRRAAATRSLH